MKFPPSVFERPCARCQDSSNWHSFKDEVNDPLNINLTSPYAIFTCNGPNFNGCAGHCPAFMDLITWTPPDIK